jgi:hypothetical protein
MSKKLLVILLVFGLVVGNLGRIPVAKATTYAFDATGWTEHGYYARQGGVFSMFTAYDLGIGVYGTYIDLASQSGWMWASSANFDVSFTHSITVDGVPVDSTGFSFYTPNMGGASTNMMFRIASVTGNHTVNWSMTAARSTGDTFAWSGSFYGDMTTLNQGNQALTVSLSGAFTTQVGVPYTATATASLGTPPYRYLFSIDWVTVIGGVNNYTSVYTGSLTSSGTFTYTFTFVGEFLIRVTALDAVDAEATDTLDLNAGVNKPVLWGQIYDIPDGDALKTYINFKLFPASVSPDNPPVANGAIQTQFYEITSPGTVEKGSVYYMLSPVLITALPNPLLIYVNYHDPVSGSDWSYVFSFNTSGCAANSGAASNGDTWTGAETPGAFAWLWDLLVKLFRFLFVPSSTDFSAQIAAGWVVITSPVPAVTPQYTIPFPNPNHLLAATGDSVNIDFGVVRDYTGYAIIKTIVQVVLDAILVFVVLSLVA